MPEGPELHMAAQFVNQICRNRVFSGKIVKSAVSRQTEIDWDEDSYSISAKSRGKELMLTLHSPPSSEVDNKKIKQKSKVKQSKLLDIVFQFGVSGKFDFYDASELKKHAHLNFFTKTVNDDDMKMVLSFVDYRRFGKWQQNGMWSAERGPCVITEYLPFRENILKKIDLPVFKKPICEVLLNQKYFNGVGNYLRAEVCYRGGIQPFQNARTVLEPLVTENSQEPKIKLENPDILQLCHIIANEVINLGGTGYDPENRDPDYSKFTEWLQCYYKDGMKNMADHNGRTMWFHGDPGPMVPANRKERKIKRKAKKVSAPNEDIKKVKIEENGLNEEGDTVKRKVTRKKAAAKTEKPITRQDVLEAEHTLTPQNKNTNRNKQKKKDKEDQTAVEKTKIRKRVSQKIVDGESKDVQGRSKQRAGSRSRNTRTSTRKMKDS